MSNVVIVGSQWGDEGKGKVVDILTEGADLVVRFQGGNNAGHTLVTGGQKYALHLVPSGILHPDKLSVVAGGVVIDPEALLEEIDGLSARGLKIAPTNLLFSERAHLILPYHQALDKAREAAKGEERIGTTGRGIGPAYEDKAARVGLRLGDLRDLTSFRLKAEKALVEKNHLLIKLYGQNPVDIDELMARAAVWSQRLSPFMADTGLILSRALAEGRHILFEGAQGVQLDLDHGTYPFVTSSNPAAGSVTVGAGVAPSRVSGVLALVKAYTTRVGAGPFPTELSDETGDYLRRQGGEFGTTTGRPRRCGWLDAAVVRHSVELCGADHLAVTKLDVLRGLKELKIATGYLLDGEKIERLPAEAQAAGRCQPIYESWPGFDDDISSARRLQDLPAAARRYLDRLSQLCGAPLGLVSVGPDREQTITLHSYY